jgi:hypothetical protein
MARAAGNGGQYIYRLFNLETGRYDHEHELRFSSVTTVIKAVLASPALSIWLKNQTMDNIAGMAAVLQGAEIAPEAILDMISDGDWLREYMKENRLRTEDIRDEASDRGKEEHYHLEQLGKIALYFDSHAADEQARKYLDSRNGWRRATGGLWLALEPDIVAVEEPLVHLGHRYAGTADVLSREGTADLKSRGAKKVVYESDHIQSGAYQMAAKEYEGLYPSVGPHRSVWLIREDGTFCVETDLYPEDTFLDLLSVYRKTRKGV